TIYDEKGSLPLLTPMSEVAGKMSVQEGAKYLERPQLGRGVLLGGVPGVAPATVVVLGGGIVGTNAAKLAAGMGADVSILDISLRRLRYLADVMPANVKPIYSDPHTIRQLTARADLVVGAVLIPGARAPRLMSRADVAGMQKGAVIVDVAVDQGGCVETTHPTTHSNPTYVVDDVLHYCVANMPGAVGRTSTYALCNATLPYARRIAGLGYVEAARRDAGVAEGINMDRGRVTNKNVADSLGLKYEPLKL
ncbi:MAG: alanine dehydrogenase, partial [Phycisphaerae bacterium]|nr:alanine dehydrogenase [Phycisphaerae bacterium]